jgi:hypothetical protein
MAMQSNCNGLSRGPRAKKNNVSGKARREEGREFIRNSNSRISRQEREMCGSLNLKSRKQAYIQSIIEYSVHNLGVKLFVSTTQGYHCVSRHGTIDTPSKFVRVSLT